MASRPAAVSRESTYEADWEFDFEHLYRTSYARVVRTLTSIVGSQQAAEDCAQEAFTSAFRAWRTRRDEVPPEAWIHRIAVNAAISHRRRERIRELPSLIRRLGVPPPGPDPVVHAHQRSVVAALRTLPPKQAAALVLRHYHGYSNREIAASLRVSERTVGQRIADALATLRSRLET